jgi:hypothetical protein
MPARCVPVRRLTSSVDPVFALSVCGASAREAMRAIASIKRRVTSTPNGRVHELEVRLWNKPSMLRPAGRRVGVAGFVARLELTGKNGTAIELQHRIEQMTDDELKALRS